MKFATDQKSHMDGVYFTEKRNSTINDHWQFKKQNKKQNKTKQNNPKTYYGYRSGKVVNECSQYYL